MDLLILVMGVAFLGLIGAGIFFFLKEPAMMRMLGTALPVKTEIPENDPTAVLQKKIMRHEEQIARLETELKAAREETEQVRGREQALLKERANTAFDAEGYEKLKNEHAALKKELTGKEEILENEISSRRRQSDELTHLKAEHEALKKKNIETEDTLRKAQTLLEGLREENKNFKTLLESQKKTIEEHNVNKSEGQWVSRFEFERLEAALKEKERLLQKFQSSEEK